MRPGGEDETRGHCGGPVGSLGDVEDPPPDPLVGNAPDALSAEQGPWGIVLPVQWGDIEGVEGALALVTLDRRDGVREGRHRDHAAGEQKQEGGEAGQERLDRMRRGGCIGHVPQRSMASTVASRRTKPDAQGVLR